MTTLSEINRKLDLILRALSLDGPTSRELEERAHASVIKILEREKTEDFIKIRKGGKG